MVAPTSKRFSRAAREREAVASGSYPWTDAPDRTAADSWARAERKLFRDAFAAAPTGIAVLDLDGTLVRVNARVPEMTGFGVGKLLGRHIETLIDGPPDGQDREALRQLIAGEAETFEREARYRRPDGAVLWVLVQLALVCDDAGEPLCVIAHLSDVTEQRAADEALRDATELFSAAFENAPIGMALIAVDGRPLQVNRALVDMTGWSVDQLLEKRITELVHADDLRPHDFADVESLLAGHDDAWRADKRFHDARGHQLWVSVSASIVRDDAGQPAYAIAQVQDISERRRLQDRLAHLANHDTLTGLANRRSFEHELERQVERASRYGETGALLLFDLDHFKYVNDSLGHRVGDELLQMVARTLSRRLRRSDMAARLGGDEFAVLMPHIDSASATQIATELAAAIREQSLTHGGNSIHPSASIGVAQIDETLESSEELFIRADVAMYEAKAAGRNRAVAHNPELGHRHRMSGELMWSERLRGAIAEGRLAVEAQPIFDLSTGQAVQCELLARLVTEDGVVVGPNDFLPHAERFGYLPSIDRFVIEEAIRLLTTDSDLVVEVNLSATSICDPELPEFVESLLGGVALSGDRLIFEFTETEALANLAIADQLSKRLAELGCRVAIDDFGSGFAGFGFVRNIAFDFLKIDGAFVRDLPSNDTDKLVVEALVHLAKGMGKKTIAEYVCDAEVCDEVTRLGVDLAQGFHLCEPVGPDALGEQLKELHVPGELAPR